MLVDVGTEELLGLSCECVNEVESLGLVIQDFLICAHVEIPYVSQYRLPIVSDECAVLEISFDCSSLLA